MIRVPVAGLREHAGETVTIAGWVHTLRLQRAMQFVLVRDHTGIVQVTHRRDGSALEAQLDQLTAESAVRVTGRVTGNPVVSLGGLEVIPDEDNRREPRRHAAPDRRAHRTGRTARLAFPRRPAAPRRAARVRGADHGRAGDA